MAKQAQVLEVLKKEVRSLLIAAKEGLTAAELEQEYLDMMGKPLPLSNLGFQSTLELVAAMPDAVRICPSEKGTSVLKAVVDESTKRIAQLVARQRDGRTRRRAAVQADAASASGHRQRFPQRGRAPVLPATLKVLPAAPAAEMAPLESSRETHNFHLTADEKPGPAERQAGGLGDDLHQAAAPSQDDPDQTGSFSKEAQLWEAVHPSILLTAMPLVLDNPKDEEQMKNKDLPRSAAAALCSASGLSDQGFSHQLYAMLSAVLASARLASSSGFFGWLPCLRKMM